MIKNGGSSGSDFTPEEMLNRAAFIVTGIYAGPTAPMEETEIPDRSWWDYLSFLWLGPYALFKGREWAEEHEKEITEWAAYSLMLLVVIAIIICLAKK